VAAFLIGWVVMSLWNAILPDLIHVSPIGYWQAIGLLVLCKILFGGFQGGGGYKKKMWKKELEEKWQHMTPEERERIKQEWRNRCRVWGKSDDTAAGAE
jgi:hypothetical protein